MVLKDQPRASAPALSIWWGWLKSEHWSLTDSRDHTTSRWRSKSSAISLRPCSAAHSWRTQGLVRRQLVQLITVPPPRQPPACRVTLRSKVGVGPPRQYRFCQAHNSYWLKSASLK